MMEALTPEWFEGRFEYDTNGGCWLWNMHNKAGYGRVAHPETGKTVAAHRAAYEAFKGPFPSELFVLHRCDVPACINPDHLFLGTGLDNIRDMDQKGRRFKKLSPDAVRHIRTNFAQQREMAKHYGVCQAVICHTLKGILHADVKD